MAQTVNEAFKEFLGNSVNLKPTVVESARISRDNLLDTIETFSGRDDFFALCSDFNVHFGSFSRKTQCRELDDIDLMIGINACGASYNPYDFWDNVHIFANTNNESQYLCANDDGTLNSTKVLNRFKKRIETIPFYLRSEIHRNGEAVSLNLVSKEWSFDLVPCFYTTAESNGRNYYLIPNGKGNWKKTDPKMDRDLVSSTNKSRQGRLLELIRLLKKWKQINFPTVSSYLMETIAVNYAISESFLDAHIHVRFQKLLTYISKNIMGDIFDLKNIQGNINILPYSTKFQIKNVIDNHLEKIHQAVLCEQLVNYPRAIALWGQIFGREFPNYG